MEQKTKILVTGANGQLGNEIRELAASFAEMSFMFIDIDELDLTDKTAVNRFFGKSSFDYVVNCAAYTAVDKAERDESTAFKVNAEAVGLLGEVTAKSGVKVIHVSTDYVFDGTANVPYSEGHPVNPVSAYGRTKLAGEELLMKNNTASVIIRTAWLYSAFGNNFVKTILRLGKERDELRVVFDQVGSPTHAADLAKAILTIIGKTGSGEREFVPGIYHYSNEGVISWYDFAYHVLNLAGVDCRVTPVLSEEYPTPAHRPAYSVLNKSKIKKLYGVEVPYWHDSLMRMLGDNEVP